MCGICGILEYGTVEGRVTESTLVSMRDEMVHRGPDDAGTFISPGRRVGFGFRRLSIVDLSPAGHQPMQTEDGAVTIVFNGEIYNHAVLRKTLEGKGYRYRSRSDTETILYCYREYGVEFVHKLLGMFSIAIWDNERRRLVLARDRIGVKPLYYYAKDGYFLFGSEIKAILRHPAVRKELNEVALEEYLTFLIPVAPRTLFRNVEKLEPGHRMVVTEDGVVTKERYWHPLGGINQPSIDLDGEPTSAAPLADAVTRHSEAEMIVTIRKLLRQSIKDRMMSDVPFGVFLSGGIDSSTNVALMAELMSRPVDTFSVGFRDLEKYNELGYARQVAERFKTNHHEVIIDEKMAFDFLPKLVWHQDEPLADPVCIPLYFVSKLARDNGTIVVQVGEGSDEQFAGYTWMKREMGFYERLWRPFTAMPKPLRALTYAAGKLLFGITGQVLPLDYIRRGAEGNELFWGGALNFTEEHKRRLMPRRWASGSLESTVASWNAEARAWLNSDDFLMRMVSIELRNRLPELLLMRVDKVAMATSVEARVPFLDHRLVEYSMRLPVHERIRNGETKYVLKKAVQSLIPDNIIHRPKQGFAAPINEWTRTSWTSFIADRLRTSFFVREGVFDWSVISDILKSHQSKESKQGQLVWNLLNLELWHRHWFEGER